MWSDRKSSDFICGKNRTKLLRKMKHYLSCENKGNTDNGSMYDEILSYIQTYMYRLTDTKTTRERFLLCHTYKRITV